jgi:hypothetical protein
MRRLVFGHIDRDDPKLAKSLAATRAAYARRSKRRTKAPRLERVEPSITLGSIQLLKGAPYDSSWTFGAEASANKADGSFHLAAQSIGDGFSEVAAGIAVWFFSPGENMGQRFAAPLNYSYDWWDMASGYVAHNDLRTRIWIWGDSEQRWVSQTEVSPQWSDGVGWFESHGNSDGGLMTIETFFPARANSWYLAWVWSDASIYADGGFWGIAASSVRFDTSVPFVVFGGLP